MRQACASCGGDKIPWRRGWTIDEVGSRALLCNACGLRWSAGRLRRVDDVPSEPPRKKKRKTSLPAAAARLPVAARVAPPCFGPRESGSGDDGATEDDGAKEVNPQAARRRSLKANLPAPAAEPFEIGYEGFDATIGEHLDGMENYTRIASLEYDIAADWKVVVDNFSEGYHIPVAHPQLSTLYNTAQGLAVHGELFSHFRNSGHAAYQGMQLDENEPYLGWTLWPNLCMLSLPGSKNLIAHGPGRNGSLP